MHRLVQTSSIARKINDLMRVDNIDLFAIKDKELGILI